MAGNMSIPGFNDIFQPVSQPVVLFGPEHAATVAAGGYSKADVKKHLHEHARIPFNRFSDENVERRLRKRKKWVDAPLDTLVPICRAPEQLTIVVIGGAGKHSAFIPTFGDTQSVTRALARADGRDALSIAELRR
jgi:hypothetical protein